jgi:hypothetical protein
LAIGTSSSREDDAQNDQPDDGKDLDGCKPELALPINPGTSEVDGEDHHKADGYPYTIRDIFIPVIDKDGGGRQLGGKDDGPVVPLNRRDKGARHLRSITRDNKRDSPLT